MDLPLLVAALLNIVDTLVSREPRLTSQPAICKYKTHVDVLHDGLLLLAILLTPGHILAAIPPRR